MFAEGGHLVAEGRRDRGRALDDAVSAVDRMTIHTVRRHCPVEIGYYLLQ